MTNLYPQQFINPIDLGGNELLNAKVQVFDTLPSVTAYSGQMVAVAGKPYFSDGVEWHDLSSVDIDNVHVDVDNTTISTFVAAHYTLGTEYHEGDMIVLTNATDAALRTYIHNGGTAGTVADFTALPSNISESFVRGALSATGAIGYDSGTGVFSLSLDAANLAVIGGVLTLVENSISTFEIADAAVETSNIANGAVTEEKLSASVAEKLNKTGHGFDLATGEPGVAYANGVYTLTHNFGTRSVAVVMRDKTSSYRQVAVVNDAPTTNTVRVYFPEQPANDQYVVTVIPMVF